MSCAIIHDATETGGVVLSSGETTQTFLKTTEFFSGRSPASVRAQRHSSLSQERLDARSFGAGLVLSEAARRAERSGAMVSRSERDRRLEELRRHLGGSFFTTIPFDIDGERVGVEVYIDYGTPYVNLQSPVIADFIERGDTRLPLLLERAREAAFDYELKKREFDFVEQQARMKAWRDAQKVKNPPIPGTIYLLRSELGQYKIGRTKRLGKRFPNFSTFLPFNVSLEHSFKAADYRAAEKLLHDRFADKRGRGEWFDLAPEDVEWICALADGALDEA